jgi:hypothetical protein
MPVVEESLGSVDIQDSQGAFDLIQAAGWFRPGRRTARRPRTAPPL